MTMTLNITAVHRATMPLHRPAAGQAAALAVDAMPRAPAALAACLQAALDQMDTGVLVCDGHGRVLLMNTAARAELADGASLLSLADDDTLQVPGEAAQLMLRRALVNAVVADRRELLPLRCQGRHLMVAVQPLRADDGGPQRALVTLGRRQLAPELVVEMLGGVYDLTYAERRVLSGLLAGERVQALATAHGVALSTLRTQVAALRAKFGVRRLDDITRLAAELPPMVSALRARPAGGSAGLR